MRTTISPVAAALLLGAMAPHLQAQTYHLSSAVTYHGRQTGEVWVVATPSVQLNTNSWTNLNADAAAPFTDVAVTVTNLWGSNYYLFAWRDMIKNGRCDTNEAQGWHPGVFNMTTGNVVASGFVLDDPDRDGDGLPDWWELQYGLPAPVGQVGRGGDGVLAAWRWETQYTDEVWAQVVGTNPAGSAILNVSGTNGFAPDDLVLIVGMRDAHTNLEENTAGVYEFGRILALTSNALEFTLPRDHAFTATPSNAIQVLKVPEYTEVTLHPATALHLGGVTADYAKVVSFAGFPSNAITVEFWTRTTNTVQKGFFSYAAGGRNNEFLVCNPSDITVYAHDGDATSYRVSGKSVNDGAWHHVAVTWLSSSGVIKFYVDGGVPSQGTSFETGQKLADLGFLFLGQDQDTIGGGLSASQALLGELKEVRIWNTVRSAEEIRAAMHARLTGAEPNLVAYWRLDEGAGAAIADATANGHNGTLHGAAGWVPMEGGQLTCHPWNGTNGGVLAFLAGNVTVGSNTVISADGKGYRGGADYACKGTNGLPGESVLGLPAGHTITNNHGGGGGGGHSWWYMGNGGGGGGYGTIGTTGLVTGSNWTNNDRPTARCGGFAGWTYGITNLARVMPGGGGGTGGQDGNDVSGDGLTNGGTGGSGGGIIIACAGTVTNNGFISARGAQGSDVAANERGYGGGGAGGTLWLQSLEYGGTAGSVQALGGRGGTNAAPPPPLPGGAGGSGGAGRIRFDLQRNATPPASDLPPGYVGVFPAATPIPWGAYDDTDRDGASDLTEYQFGSIPTNTDTDSDAMPDGWEAANGLNPTNPADAVWTQDLDGDGVPNLLEYYRGTRPNTNDTDGDGLRDDEELFLYHTDPVLADTDGDGISDGSEARGGGDPRSADNGIRYYYDAIDRLVGAQYPYPSNGLALGYEYDGDNNLIRQTYLERDGNANGLPDLWEFLNGLTNGASGYADTDGDGWSDYQEWQGDSSPTNAASTPNLLGDAGLTLSDCAMILPFTPSNYVIGVGQLDGIGAEEIVVGADGDPGGATNFLLVLSQSAAGWSTQRVDVGSFGVTSIGVGQPANRPAAGIYIGLRAAGGTGGVAEVAWEAGQWTNRIIAYSTNECAEVLDVRPGRYVRASLAGTNTPPGCPHYLSFAAGVWTSTVASTSSSHRGLGTVTVPGPAGLVTRGLRLLDSGGLQVVGHEVRHPTNAVWREDYSRWFFNMPGQSYWSVAQDYARTGFGGNLVTVTDGSLNAWLATNLLTGWIGLSRLTTNSPVWEWASGAPCIYANWAAGEPNNTGGIENRVFMYPNGTWNDCKNDAITYGIIEVDAMESDAMSAAEPAAFSQLLWRGCSLNAGHLRSGHDISILYTFVDDKNASGTIDDGDEFVMAEYVYTGGAVTNRDVQRIPLSGSSLAQSYGLACVDVLYDTEQVLFTAEPDGRIFSWAVPEDGSALQRQLFSAGHSGYAWHALAAVRTLESGESLAGLRVNPANPQRCDVILWSPQNRPWQAAEVPQTAPVTQILPEPSQGTNIALVDIRLWDAEGGPAEPELQYLVPGSVVWSNATVTAVDSQTNASVLTDATGLTHRLSWSATNDFGYGFTNTLRLRARAADIALTGDWSAEVEYLVMTTALGSELPEIDLAAFGRLPGGWIHFMIPGETNDVFQVQANTNLLLGAWDNVSRVTNFADLAEFKELIMTNLPRRFYRVILTP